MWTWGGGGKQEFGCFEEQKLFNFSSIKEKLKTLVLPCGINVAEQKEERIIHFIALKVNSIKIPEIHFSLSIHEDLSFKMALNGIEIPIKSVCHLNIVNGKLTDITSIANILAYIMSKAEIKKDVSTKSCLRLC